MSSHDNVSSIVCVDSKSSLTLYHLQVKDHPVKEHGGETPGKVILSKEPEIEVCLHMDVTASPFEFHKKLS